MARTAPVIDELELPKEAEKLGESTDEQESSTPKLSSIGFFEQLSRFTNVEWEQHIIYVYRLAPITDRTAGGTTKYVQKYASRFDQETLKADLGSGRYRLQLNRYDSKGQSKTVRTFEIDIEDMNFPPKVPPGEWLDDPRNKRWAWARDKKAEPLPAAGDSWSPERVMKFVKELRPDVPQNDQISITKAVLDAVKETRKEMSDASNPATMLSTLKELILLAKPEAPAAKPEGESQTFTLIMRMLDAAEKRAEQAIADAREDRKRAEEDRKRAHEIELAERKHAHELQLEQLKQRADAASPVSMVKEVLLLQKQIGQLGSDEPRDWKEKLVDQGFEALPDILGAIKGYTQRAPVQTTQPRQPVQPQPAPTAQTQPAAQPATQPATGESVEPQTPLDPDIAFLLPIFEIQGRLFVAAFTNDPSSGGDVARSVALYAGNAVYERIARMGPEKILATIEMLPQMKADLLKAGSLEMLNDFILDFIDGPEPPDDPEPPTPETPRKPRKPKEAAVV